MRRAKRALALLLTLLLAVALIPMSALAAGETFEVSFECDKTAYNVGDTAVVNVYLKRTDAETAYALYNFTDQVVFNSDLLRFAGSDSVAADIRLDSGVGGNGSPYLNERRYISLRYQYTSHLGTPPTRAASLLIATLKFEILTDCNTTLRHAGVEIWTSPNGDTGESFVKEDAAIVAGTPETYDLTFLGGAGVSGSTAAITGINANTSVQLPTCGYSKTGKTFGGWYDGTAIYNAGVSFKVTEDKTFTALWNPAVVTYRASRGGDAVGAYTGTNTRFYTGTSMNCGTAVTFTAMPSDGYRFEKWSDGVTENPRSLTVMGDVYLEASFAVVSGGNAPSGGENVPVIVDGETYNIGTRTETDTTTTVTVDQSELEKRMENAHSTVVVPVAAETDAVSAQLVVKNVEDMAEKSMTLSVKTDGVSYDMRATAVDTSAIMTALGADAPEKVPVSVTITQLSESAVTLSKGELVIPPVEFVVTAEYEGKIYEVSGFEKYVTRTISIPSNIDASKITTAVVTENGTQRHVPTNVYMSGGKWYARISSLTNSTYALIYDEASFTDAVGKWYEAVVTEMASRGIINGRSASVFDGGANITRAEFAAILVRALGLPQDGDASAFADVAKSAWYSGAVGKAYEYGLINGRTAISFDPQANITRQEAMAMVHRAAAITEFTGANGALSAFSDVSSISAWALKDAQWNVGSGLIQGNSAGMICGGDNITRGETATIILRLLQKSALVDVRTKA